MPHTLPTCTKWTGYFLDANKKLQDDIHLDVSVFIRSYAFLESFESVQSKNCDIVDITIGWFENVPMTIAFFNGESMVERLRNLDEPAITPHGKPPPSVLP